METDCPCGSGQTYGACCGLFHSGAATAPTAQALMRSRYSAFAVGDADYLLATWCPTTRPASVELDQALEWRRLQIRGLSAGGEMDDTGTVEFVAHYWDSTRGEYGRQHENSRFVREARDWFYVDAVS
jgi:SEC-C motif-containing protein